MDPAAAAHTEKSRLQRLTFEQRAMAMVIIVLALALAVCFVALWPAEWAKQLGSQITAMRDNIVYFVGLIAANLGISFARGGHDQHVSSQGDS